MSKARLQPMTLFGEKPARPPQGTARISEDGLYRYDLTRSWPFIGSCKRVVFVMINPSIASATVDDPTMTRVLNFAKSWGYSELVITNLFALISTDPEALRKASDPIGPENDESIRRWVTISDLTIVAWGSHSFARKRAKTVLDLIRECGKTPHYLRLTKDGHPWHPLYLPGNLRPMAMENRS